MRKIGQKVSQTAVSWKTASAALNLPVTLPTGTSTKEPQKLNNNTFLSKINNPNTFSKRIQGTVAQKKLRLAMDAGAQHIYICEHHKNVIQVGEEGQ